MRGDAVEIRSGVLGAGSSASVGMALLAAGIRVWRIPALQLGCTVAGPSTAVTVNSAMAAVQ